MTRTKSAVALALVVLLGLSINPAARAIDFAQSMGFGYGPGYNAPSQGPVGYGAGYNGSWPYCTWQRGCCEIPATWRTHVWDGYGGDKCTWHTSFCGVPKNPNGSGYGAAGCPTCPPAGNAQFGSGYATPASVQQPVPAAPQPAQN